MISEMEVKKYIGIAKIGEKVENPKVELKREWWNLEETDGQQEFIKDVTAMANTPGNNGYFIIGVDENDGKLFHAHFPSGKYNDPGKLGQLIGRKVQEPMTIECYSYIIDGQIIYVLEVPHSYNKPHIIKQHKNTQNFIPIRKSTNIYAADKFDLDLMYSERNRIVIPQYRLDLHLTNPTKIMFNGIAEGKPNWTCIVNISNTGTNINMIPSGKLYLYKGKTEISVLEHINYFIPDIGGRWQSISGNQFIKIRPNDIVRINIGFKLDTSNEQDVRDLLGNQKLQGFIELTDISMNTYQSSMVNLI